MKRLVGGVLKFTCKVIYGLKVYGLENIPKEGPIIICGNHRSFLDAPLIEVTCGKIPFSFFNAEFFIKYSIF